VHYGSKYIHAPRAQVRDNGQKRRCQEGSSVVIYALVSFLSDRLREILHPCCNSLGEAQRSFDFMGIGSVSQWFNNRQATVLLSWSCRIFRQGNEEVNEGG
jgi:hypothetical protein